MNGNLVQLMARLGMAAVVLSAKMERLTAGFVVEPDDEVRELTDRLVHAAIAYTMRLIILNKFGTATATRELEKKLISRFEDSDPPTDFDRSDFEHAVETLAASARAYAYATVTLAESVRSGADSLEAATGGREPSRQLGNAAIAFTMRLTVAYSNDPTAVRETTRQMEEFLIAKVNEGYATWKEKA